MSNEQVYTFPWGKRIVKPNGEVVEVRNEDRLRHSDAEPIATEEAIPDDTATEPVVSRYVKIPRDGEPWWSELGATRVDTMF